MSGMYIIQKKGVVNSKVLSVLVQISVRKINVSVLNKIQFFYSSAINLFLATNTICGLGKLILL
jgi:hypothetical protein